MDIEKKLLKKESLEKLVLQLNQQGKHVYAPVRKENQVNYSRISDLKEMASDYIVTGQSVKSVAFPKIEKLLDFDVAKSGITMHDRNLDAVPQVVVIGTRPCDADGFASLNAIFSWDLKDEIYFTRYNRTTIIGMSCAKCDEFCFCTSLGSGPGATKGSDILLTKTSNDDYLAEIVTEKGKALVDANASLFETYIGEEKDKFLADVPVKFDLPKVVGKLPSLFPNEDFWLNLSLPCYGCGACAFVCPTCACFDIQDESKLKNGLRVRTWDSCGFGLFTMHTSGHNPREIQSHRWRQRIMHKFSYMPDRLNVVGCVGCGRCSRACGADMNILNSLTKISEA